MSDPVETLREQLSTVAIIDRSTCSGLAALDELDDADLVALLPAVQALVQTGQGLLALVAGEIAARDGGAKGPSLARRLGSRNARGLVADRAGLSYGQAASLVEVGEAIRPRVASSGEPLEPERPHLAEAVLAGELSLHVALLIDDTLAALRCAVSALELDALEAVLVEKAVCGECSVTEFTKECRRLVEKADPAGADDRDTALKARASIRESRVKNGLLRIVAELDPERAAYYLAAVRAKTNPRRVQAVETDTDGPQPDPMVSRLDAFASICKDSLKADDGVQAGVDTTVLVRIDLHDLLEGIGSATIDGIDSPISAASARRMAVNAELIPQVFGGASQLLDQGMVRRLFSKAQRHAIYAGYDSCAFPGCDLPLSMTEIHHLGRWGERHRHGRGTDLCNGIPLCGFHNRLMEQGWDCQLDPDGVPWFTPPATLDRLRAPRRGHHRAPPRAA